MVRMAAGLFLLLGARATGPTALAIEITQTAKFETKKQSLFGTGPATVETYNLPLIFDWGTQANPLRLNPPLVIGDPLQGTGIHLNASSYGKFGLNNMLTIDPGGIDSSLDYNLTMRLPTYANFKGGNFEVSVLSPTLTKGAFNTKSPSLQFYSDFVAEAHASISGFGRVDHGFGQAYAGTFNKSPLFDLPPVLNETNQPYRLISFNLPDGTLSALPSLDTLKRARATAKLFSDLDVAATANDRLAVAADALKFKAGVDAGTIVKASFKAPSIALDASYTGNTPGPRTISQGKQDEFASLKIDLAALLTEVSLKRIPLKFKTGLDFVAGSLSAKAAILEADITPSMELSQHVAVKANDVLVTFNFGRDVRVGLKNPDGSADTTPKQTITIKAGQTLLFREDQWSDFDPNIGPNDMNLQPTYTMDANLQSEFGISLGGSSHAAVLKGDVKADLLGFELLKGTFRPVKEGTVDWGSTGQIFNLVDREFALGGFNTVKGATVVLSAKPALWTGGAGSSLSAAGNWDKALLNLIPRVIATETTVDADTNEEIGPLSLQGNAPQVKVFANVDLRITGDVALAINSDNAGLLVQQGGTARLANPTQPPNPNKTEWILGGPGRLRLDGDGATPAKLIAEHSLTVRGAGIDGYGDATVANTLKLEDGLVLGTVTGKTLNMTSEKVQFVGGDGVVSIIGASPGAMMKLKTTHATVGIERTGGTDNQRIALLAGAGGTLSLDVPTIDSAQFLTDGTGKVVLDRDMTLSNIVNDGTMETTRQIELAGASFVNNGLFRAKVVGQMVGTVRPTANLTLDGVGTLRLAEGKLQLPAGTTLVNAASHTISSDLGIALVESRDVDDSFNNQGRLHGYAGTLELTTGRFNNEGLFESSAGGKLNMTGDAKLQNLATAGNLVLTGGRYRLSDFDSSMTLRTGNASTNFVNRATIELFGDRDPVNGSGLKIDTNGTTTDLVNMTTFLNDGQEFDQSGALLHSGGQITIGGRRRFITGELVNKGIVTLGGDAAGTKAEVGKVTNQAGGLVQATLTVTGNDEDAVLQMKVANNTATNQGTIRSIKNRNRTGSINLIVKGSGGNGEKFKNEGTVEVRNAKMTFDGLKVDHGMGNQFVGGRWVVEGIAHRDFQTGNVLVANTTTLDLDLNLNAAPTVLAADVSLIGENSHLKLQGAEIESTMEKISATGILSVHARTMEFSNNLTNDGQINLGSLVAVTPIVTAGSTTDIRITRTDAELVLKQPEQNSVGLTNNGVLAGAGKIVARGGSIANTFFGEILASDGELNFYDALVKNDGIIKALGPDEEMDLAAGVIGLTGATIDCGTVHVEEGAGLIGYGKLTNLNLTNDGIIVTRGTQAADTPLVIDIVAGAVSNVVNNGEMIATQGQRLVLQAPTRGHLNNPGMLVITSAPDDSALTGFSNGKIDLLNTTVGGGRLVVLGEIVAPLFNVVNWQVVLDEQMLKDSARVVGHGSTLDQTEIYMESGVLVADPVFVNPATNQTEVKDKTFEITPKTGTIAEFVDSTLLAVNGGHLLLRGEYHLEDSEIVAYNGVIGDDAMFHPSVVKFRDAAIRGGVLKTLFGGQIQIGASTRFINVSSQTTIAVPANTTLELAKVFYNNAGTLQVDGTLRLDGTDRIGGDTQIASGSDLLGGHVEIKNGATLEVVKKARILGANVGNHGQIMLDNDDDLTIRSFDVAATDPRFTNDGTIDIDTDSLLAVENATLVADQWQVTRAKMVNKGGVVIRGTLFAGRYRQTAGGTVVEHSASGGLWADVDLEGGSLSGTGDIFGDLNHTGGVVSPGVSAGVLTVEGNYDQAAMGRLIIELAGASSFDRLAIVGTATLGGILETVLTDGFQPAAGNAFEILTAADGLAGTFVQTILPPLDNNLTWNVSYGANSVTLQVVSPCPPGDFNSDCKVDAADYVLWRKVDGTPEGYAIWRSNFGSTNGSATGLAEANSSVPEPSVLALVCIAWGLLPFQRRLG